MPAPISKDSTSRCGSSTTIYDIIRNPHARPIPPKPQVASPDTLESTQGRLNREVLERFKTTGLRLPHETFVAVVQVGKFVVLAIMLPPYLCLYGLPKWFLLSAFPSCFIFVKFHVLKVGRFFMEMAKASADIMKGLMEQMIGDALKIGKHKAQKLGQSVLSMLTFVPKKIYKGIKSLQNLQAQVRQNIGAHFSKSLNSFLKKYENIKSRIQSKISYISRLCKKATQHLQETVKALTQPFVHALHPYYNATLRFFSNIRNKLSELPKNIKKHALTPRKLAENVLRKIKSFVAKISLTEAIEKAKIALEPVHKFLRKISEASYNTFAQVAGKVRDYTNAIIGPLLVPIQALSTMTVQAALWMWSLSKKAFNHGLEFSLNPLRKLKLVFKKMKQLLWALSARISRGVKWSFNAAKKACRAVSKASVSLMRKLVAWVLQSPRKLWELILKAFAFFLRALKATFFAGRFFVAMSLAIVQLCFLLIREAFTEMSGWMSKQRN